MDGTCGIKQDNNHEESIMTCIKQHVDIVSAVLILVKAGTIADMDCTLSALSALFPKTLANNTAFVFTRIWDSPFFKLPLYTVPEALRNCPKFFLDNPITPPSYNKYYPMRRRGKGCEPGALKMLVTLFNWLGNLEPQTATEIVCFYEQYQNIETKAINILDQRPREVGMRAEIERLMITLKKHLAVSLLPCLHLALESYPCGM